MIAELDKVTLTAEIPLESIFDVPPQSPLLSANGGGGLIPGDVGTVMHVQGGGAAFVVEFMEWNSWYPVALADVLASQIRPATERDIANARFLGKRAARTDGRDNLIE